MYGEKTTVREEIYMMPVVMRWLTDWYGHIVKRRYYQKCNMILIAKI